MADTDYQPIIGAPLAHDPTDATVSPNPIISCLINFASLKSRLVLRFWYQLTQIVLEKMPLNGCSSSSSSSSSLLYHSNEYNWCNRPNGVMFIISSMKSVGCDTDGSCVLDITHVHSCMALCTTDSFSIPGSGSGHAFLTNTSQAGYSSPG